MKPSTPTLWMPLLSRSALLAITTLTLASCSQVGEILSLDRLSEIAPETSEPPSGRSDSEDLSDEDAIASEPEQEEAEVEEPRERRFVQDRLDMTPDRLITIAEDLADDVQEGDGFAQMDYEGVTIGLLWSEEFDRMRLIAEVVPVSQLSSQELQIMMEANYHLTLDARYATSQGTLFATFIHPLSPLDEDSFRSGIHQVASLVQNFGTTYSSDALTFGGGERPDPIPAPDGFLDI